MKPLAVILLLLVPAIAAAQTPPSGFVSVFGDYLPNRDNTVELRGRIFAEEVLDPTPKLLITASAFVEGLVAKRATSRTDAIFRVQEASVDYKGGRVDVFAGFATMAWGRLDELQPTDVVNPLDVSRFFFEGRSEARLPVGLGRVRYHASENASFEGVFVPFFRKGRFDQLDEPTSPFNLATLAETQAALAPPPGLALPPFRVTEREPSSSLRNAQGGARFNATSGRVDWSLSVYDGIEPFGLYQASAPAPTAAFVPVEIVYPRFTMVGADFETVRGQWGLRGELATFVRDSFQETGAITVTEGHSIDAGVGVDRKAGSYRLSATVLVHHESYDRLQAAGTDGRTDVSMIVSTDRTFARERYQLRGFGVYNPSEGSAFLRTIATAKLGDNLALEGSGGWFIGDGRDLVGRFSDNDFVYLRLKYYF